MAVFRPSSWLVALVLTAAISGAAFGVNGVLTGPTAGSHFAVNQNYNLDGELFCFSPYHDDHPYMKLYSNIDAQGWVEKDIQTIPAYQWTVVNKDECFVDWKVEFWWECGGVVGTEDENAGRYYSP